MRAILTFYLNFAVVSIAISLLSCVMILYSRSPYFTINVFWIKVVSNAGLLTYIYFFRAQQFNFFFNLGYSIRQLYVRAVALDFSICSLLVFVTLQLL